MAELSTLVSILAALRGWNFRMVSASSTFLPRIISATIRTWRGDSRNPFRNARAITSACSCRTAGDLAVAGVAV